MGENGFLTREEKLRIENDNLRTLLGALTGMHMGHMEALIYGKTLWENAQMRRHVPADKLREIKIESQTRWLI